MPYPLNNGTTDVGYTAAATLVTQPVSSVFVQVNNAAVYWRATTQRDGVEQPPGLERFLLPGKGTFAQGTDWRDGELLIRLEFRSATATPAQVSAG